MVFHAKHSVKYLNKEVYELRRENYIIVLRTRLIYQYQEW
jgi:hypothetical protein